jgi:hypothetical protein
MFQSKKPQYRVLVCGGRDYGKRWDDHQSSFVTDTHAVHRLHRVLEDIQVPEGSDLVIVHGAAAGADNLASTWAKNKHITEMPFPADWSGGKSAGIERNIEMLEESEPDLIVAFPGGKGTAHMVGLARKTKTPLIVVTDEE